MRLLNKSTLCEQNKFLKLKQVVNLVSSGLLKLIIRHYFKPTR